jgi:hypothetical protein
MHMTIARNMTMMARLRAGAARLQSDNRAVAMLETAITMPTLIFAGLAGLEIANLMITHTRVSGIALTVADNASRMAPSAGLLAAPRVSEADINDVFTGAQLQSGNLNIQANGRVILSSLETNPDGGQWIHWQRCYGSKPYSSSFGGAGTGVTGNAFEGMGMPGRQIRATPGSPVMFAEVFIDYQPFMFDSWIGARTINYTSAFVARDSRDTTTVTNAQAVAIASC